VKATAAAAAIPAKRARVVFDSEQNVTGHSSVSVAGLEKRVDAGSGFAI